MIDPVTGMIISGGLGLLGNIMGGSKSKGSTSVVPKAGEWDPQMKQVWDSAMAEIFGDANTPTLKDRTSADDQYQRNAYNDFFQKSGASTQGFLDQLGGAATKYLGNPVSGSVGGQGVSFIPKSSARSFNDLAGYLQQVLGAKDVYDTRVLNYNKEYTPYRADQNYLNQILPMAMELQKYRWGNQTSAQLEPSLMNDLATAGEVVSPWIKLFNKKPETYNPYIQEANNMMEGTYGGYN